MVHAVVARVVMLPLPIVVVEGGGRRGTVNRAERAPSAGGSVGRGISASTAGG